MRLSTGPLHGGTGGPVDFDFSAVPQKADTAIVAEDAINAMLKAWCRKSVVFRVVGDEEGSWRTLGLEWEGNEELASAHLAKKYGTKLEVILNERIAPSLETS